MLILKELKNTRCLKELKNTRCYLFIDAFLSRQIGASVLTAVPKTHCQGNFLNFALFWCAVIYSNGLK